MSWRLMLHFDRNGDEPPACTIGNSCAQDLATETQFLGHVDITQLGNMQGMPINRKFIVGQVKAQFVLFLTLEARKARFLSILAWVFELGLGSFLFHAPVVGKGLSKIGKCLFWSAFGHFVAPGKVFTFDLVVFRLEIFHLDPFACCTSFFPASQCPVKGVSFHAAGFAEVHLLFWRSM